VYFHYLPDFLQATTPDEIRSWRLLYGDPSRSVSMKSFGLFFQDDFRATRRLTLNLGLRYDVTLPIKDSQNRLANYVPSQGIVQVGYGIDEPYKTNWKNISPRLGFAYDLFGTGKTILRSGFGMIYVQPSIRTFMFASGGLQLNPSALINPGANGTITSYLLTDGSNDLLHWDTTGPIFPVNDSSLNTCDANKPCNIFGVDQNLKTPYVLNWNFSLQQELTPSMVLQMAYVANRGVQLYSTVDLNQAPPNPDGFDSQTRPMTASCDPPVGLGTGNAPCYPYIAFLNFLGNQSTSSYHSLQMTLTKRYARGLYLLAGYTWQHAIDTAGNTNNLGYIPQNSFDYAAEKGDGDYDIRHRFTLSATYDLPSRKAWGQMLEGWQVTSIFTWQSGPPVLLWDDTWDLSGTDEGPDDASNERWNIKGDPSRLKWSAKAPIPFLTNTYDDDGNLIAYNPTCASVARTQALLDSLAYVGGCYAQNGTILFPQAFGTFGNMGRNIFRGPGFINWDASVTKTWRLTERVKMQLRGEMFNVANHANFAPFSMGEELGDPSSLGRVNATPDVQTANPVIGSGGSRHIQLGVKFIW
jgi:hypothetical protein